MEILKILSLAILQKNEKGCSEENRKGVAEQSFDKEIMGATHKFDQSSQQKLGIEMGLHQQKRCQLGLKRTEKMK